MLRTARKTLQILAAAGAFAALAAGPAVAADPGAYTTKGAWSFVSAPNLHPPKLHTDRSTQSKKLAPGYFFLANFKNLLMNAPMTGEGGPMILNSQLQPVWFYPIGTKSFANNLAVQTYQGKPALSWWQGIIDNTGATRSGQIYVVDQHYRSIGKPLSGADGWTITQHEALITGHDIWVTATKPEPMDLSAIPGASGHGLLLDAAVQKYDLRTGQLLYNWDAAAPGHIPLTDSYAAFLPNPAAPWDAYHINTIQLQQDGFIVTMRNDWAAYSVDSKGAIRWILGGKRSTFRPAAANAKFEWPHDVQLRPHNVVTVFDNHCCQIEGPGKLGPPDGTARGLVLKLDLTNHTYSFVQSYSRNLDVGFQGNLQLQPNGNVVMGWGARPYFTEFSRTGQILLDAVFPGADLNYRAYLSNWVGTPFFPPSGAARKSHGKDVVYASWDGATQVVSWRVLAGSDAGHLATVVSSTTKTNFETSITLTKTYNVFKVQALDSKGHVIGTSKAFSVPKATTPSQNPPGFY